MTLRLIVGLGNPGAEYAQTRHNAGVWFLDALCSQFGATMRPDKNCAALSGRTTIAGVDVRLLFPTSFMNLSGRAIASVAHFYKIQPEEILLAHDELDLDPGIARIKQAGGHGGHNGLKSTIECLGNQRNFYRLRIGIGHPGDRDLVTPYVLGKPSKSDARAITACIDTALSVVEPMVQGKWAESMHQLHTFKG